MYPVLFKIGNFTVYGYGFMLSVTFIVASLLLQKELERKNMDTNLVGPVTILAVVFGWLGSKLFDAFEHWDRFIRNPVKMLLSGSGLTFLGGFILAALAILIFLRAKRVPFLRFADATSPGLMIGYGIARVGCQLSGDGDYGLPSDLPWAMGYPKGTVPTLAAKNPELVEAFQQMYPGREVPTDIQVHPTPVYETLASFLLFAFLWKLRKRPAPDGWLFFVYLVISGTERLLIEFIRLNPKWAFGLSQSQLLSVGLILAGTIGLMIKRREKPAVAAP